MLQRTFVNISATVPLGTQWSVHKAQSWLAGSVDLGLDLDLELVLNTVS